MKPQDVVLLLKIIAINTENWQQKPLANELKMSQSEVSQALVRLKYAGLMLESGKQVMRLALMDFLQYGFCYVFPQKPGAIVRGIATAHSALPLNKKIVSNENYVWPYAKGNIRGQAIIPLFKTLPEAIDKDEKFYQLITLVDALRVGRKREKELAIEELKNLILNGK
jgi:biotin operon repressor